MAQTVGDHLLSRLGEWGVQRIYGYPGDGINGLLGICVDEPARIAAAWDEALAADRPTVLGVYTDPEVPPLPPHLTSSQVRAYLSALRKGDPQALDMVRATARDFLAPILPHRG